MFYWTEGKRSSCSKYSRAMAKRSWSKKIYRKDLDSEKSIEKISVQKNLIYRKEAVYFRWIHIFLTAKHLRVLTVHNLVGIQWRHDYKEKMGTEGFIMMYQRIRYRDKFGDVWVDSLKLCNAIILTLVIANKKYLKRLYTLGYIHIHKYIQKPYGIGFLTF